jgi:hypothetical protein
VSTLLAYPNIKVDGDFSDWVSSERIDNPGNSVPGYELFGTVQNDTYYIGVEGTLATDPAIGAGTTIWLNTTRTLPLVTARSTVSARITISHLSAAPTIYTPVRPRRTWPVQRRSPPHCQRIAEALKLPFHVAC